MPQIAQNAKTAPEGAVSVFYRVPPKRSTRQHSLLNQGRKDVLLNLAQVSYVDSAGLGAIVGAYTTMTREGGSLKLANVTKKLQDLLSITKLLTVFETFDSEDEGLRSYK